MKSPKGEFNTEENGTPAPITSPALPVDEDEVRDLDLSSLIQITDHEVLFQSKGNFRCKCKAKFKNLPLLKLHIRTRVEKPRFKCHPCNFVFFFESQLKKHQKSKKCGQKTANYVAGPSSSGSNGNGVGISLESGQDQLLDLTPVSASSSSSDQLPQTQQATEKGEETDPIRSGLLREVRNGNSIESKPARELVICLTRLDMSSLPPPRMSPRQDEMRPQNSNHTTPPRHSKVEVEQQSVVVTQEKVVNPANSDEEERQNDSSWSSNQHSPDDDQMKSEKCTQIAGPSESNGNEVGTCLETDDELVDLVPISASSSNQLTQTKRSKKKGKGRDRGSRRKFHSRRSFLRQVQNEQSVKSKRALMVKLERYLRKCSLRRRMSLMKLGVPPQTSKQHSSDNQMKSKKWRQNSANYIAVPSESNGNGVGTCSGILDQLFAPVSSSSSNQLPQTKQPKRKGKGEDQDAKRKFRTRKSPLREVQNGRSAKSKHARGQMASLAGSLGISSLRQKKSSRRLGMSPQTSKVMPPQLLEIEMEEKAIIPVNNDERIRHTDSSGSSNQPSNLDATRSLSQMDEMQLFSGIINADQHENGDSIGLARATGRIDVNFYGCILCARDFRMLAGLRKHLVEWHNAKRSEVRCGKCGMEFGGCKTFHKHRQDVHLQE